MLSVGLFVGLFLMIGKGRPFIFPEHHFWDLLRPIQEPAFRIYTASPEGQYACYFPLTYVLLAPFVWLAEYNSGDMGPSLNIFLLLSVLGPLVFFYREFRVDRRMETLRYVFTIVLLSQPFLFAFFRANVEFFVFFSFCAFFLALRNQFYYLSAFFLACAAAMKGFPALCFLIFLRKGHLKHAAFFCIVAALLLTLPFLYQPGGFDSVWAMIGTQKRFTLNYVIGDEGFNFSHSLFTLLKYCQRTYGFFAEMPVDEMYGVYLKVIAGLSLLVCSYLVFLERSFFRFIAICVCVFCLFPGGSADYKLLYFLLVVAAFVNSEEFSATNYVYALLLSLILMPKNFWPGVYAGVWINPLLMTTFLLVLIAEGSYLALRSKSQSRWDDDTVVGEV